MSSPLVEVERFVKEFLEKWPVGADVPAEAFAQGPELVPDRTSEQTRRQILRTLGVVDVKVGRGGPAKTALGALESSQQILNAAREIWKRLENSSERVTKEQLEADAEQVGLKGERTYAPADLLKQLGLAVGVQRAGGLRNAERAEREAVDAVDAVEKRMASPSPSKEDDSKEKEGEASYYELIASLLETSEEDCEATVVGGEQVGRGEWSTPDVVAVSVMPAPSLVLPVVRIFTVEVKLRLSRVAIAEASAHKRFAHYAYVGVPQAAVDMPPWLIAELAASGLGLICPRQRGRLTFYVHLQPQLNRPDEEDVEELLQRFRALPNGDTMSNVTRDRVRRALRVLFEG